MIWVLNKEALWSTLILLLHSENRDLRSLKWVAGGMGPGALCLGKKSSVDPWEELEALFQVIVCKPWTNYYDSLNLNFLTYK